MTLQIKAAAKLGFPIARVQISITPDSMEALAPIAEEHGVTLALEVHADQYASHPRILALRDRYEKVGSPFLGFTMDWGATVTGFAPSLLEAYRRRGASRRAARQGRRPVERVLRAGPAGRPGRARPAVRLVHRPRRAERPPRPRHRLRHQRHRASSARRASTTGSRSCRGSGTCTASSSASTRTAKSPRCPCATSIRLLVENGYSGAISSEYEGWHWNHWQSPFDIIARRAGRAALGRRRRRLAHDHGCRRSTPHPRTPTSRSRSAADLRLRQAQGHRND